jgi:hypothetical protein
MSKIIAYLGGLRVALDTAVIRDAIESQTPDFIRGGRQLEPQAQTLRFALKGVFRLGLEYTAWQITRSGGNYPLPDKELRKADALGYGITYFLDMILHGLSSQEWDIAYVDHDTSGAIGGIEITGLVATVDATMGTGEPEPAGDGETPATLGNGALPDGSASAGEPDSSEHRSDESGPLDHSGDIGEWQNHMGQTANPALV